MSPTSNYVDHGFYSFSPTLFHDFYSENGFEIDQCRLFRHTYDVEGKAWIAGDYSPGSLDSISFGGLDDGLYATFFVATKTAASTAHRIPQQSLYRRHWAKKNPAAPTGPDSPDEAFTQKVSSKDEASEYPSAAQTGPEEAVPDQTVHRLLTRKMLMAREDNPRAASSEWHGVERIGSA